MIDPNATQTPDPAHPDVTISGDIQASITNTGGIHIFRGDVYVQVVQGAAQLPRRKVRLFLSYTRADDEGLSESSFMRRLYHDLTARGFDVWWDRVSMLGRGLTYNVPQKLDSKTAVYLCQSHLMAVVRRSHQPCRAT